MLTILFNTNALTIKEKLKVYNFFTITTTIMRLITFFTLLIGIIVLVIILNSLITNNNQPDTTPMVSSSSSSSFRVSKPFSSKAISSSLSSSSLISSVENIEIPVVDNTPPIVNQTIVKSVISKPIVNTITPKEEVVVNESKLVSSVSNSTSLWNKTSVKAVQEQSQSSKAKSSSNKSITSEQQSWAKQYEAIESVPDILPTNVLVISKSKQTFSLIRDNKEVLTGDLTTGGSFLDPNGGWSETHTGIYWVGNKSRNVKMKMFNTPDKVSKYFISLIGKHSKLNPTNIGIHDSPWRNNFGADFDYKNKGTNGCITAPAKLVEKLFGIMELNDLVFIVD